MNQFRICIPITIRRAADGFGSSNEIVVEISADSSSEAIARFQETIEYVINNRSEIETAISQTHEHRDSQY